MAEFKEVRPSGPGTGRLKYVEKGYVKIGLTGIYFGVLTFDALNRAPYIGVYIDKKERLLKLSEGDEDTGWKTRIVDSRAKNRWMLTVSPQSEIKKLPVGIYVPIGGEVYAYKDELNRTE